MKAKILCAALLIFAPILAFAEVWEGKARAEAAYKCTTTERGAYDFWRDCEENYLKSIGKPYKAIQKLGKNCRRMRNFVILKLQR